MKNKTSSATKILKGYIDSDPELKAMVSEVKAHRQIALLIQEIRNSEGLSQEELARLTGTSQSTIARLENEEYSGHTLTMLSRILGSMNRDLQITAIRKVS